jgi:uncharacterized RDD family membrane protein YckC
VRFVAALVDGLLLVVVDALLIAVVGRGPGVLVAVLLDLLYLAYFEGSPSGQTPGKRLLAIRVLDAQTEGRVQYPLAVLRAGARLLSFAALLAGYLWVLWDDERQAWHDKLAQTIVVPAAAYPVDHWP